MKIISENNRENKTRFSLLKEFTITDDGVTIIKLAMFQDVISSLEKAVAYFLDLQVVIFQNS